MSKLILLAVLIFAGLWLGGYTPVVQLVDRVISSGASVVPKNSAEVSALADRVTNSVPSAADVSALGNRVAASAPAMPRSSEDMAAQGQGYWQAFTAWLSQHSGIVQALIWIVVGFIVLSILGVIIGVLLRVTRVVVMSVRDAID